MSEIEVEREEVEVEKVEVEEDEVEREELGLGEKGKVLNSEGIYDIRICDTHIVSTQKDQHVDYHIEIFHMDREEPKVIYRRFSEFALMHKMMKLQNPDIKLPEFPSKSVLADKLDRDLVNKRKLSLEKYMKEVYTIPACQKSFYFQLFLSLIDLSDKVVVITGGTTGIGVPLTTMLARLGADIYCASKDETRGKAIVEQIRHETGHSKIHYMQVDMMSMESIDQFLAAFTALSIQVDLLLLKAEIGEDTNGVTEDGFEIHFGVNYLAHVYIVHRLMPLMRDVQGSRVVYLVPKLHTKSESLYLDRIRTDAVESKQRMYLSSKLALAMHCVEMAHSHKEKQITFQAVDPGEAATASKLKAYPNAVAWVMKKKILIPVEQSAISVLYTALSDQVRGTGNYLHNTDPCPFHVFCSDELQRTTLMQITQECLGERLQSPDAPSEP